MNKVRNLVVGLIIGLLVGAVVSYEVSAGQLSAKDTQIAGLQGYVSTLQGEVTWLQNQIDTRDTQITTLQTQLTGNITLVTKLQGWLAGNLTLISQLQNQATNLQAQLMGNTTILTQLNTSYYGLLSNYSVLQTWLSGNLTRNAMLETQVSTLTTEVNNLTTQVASLGRQVTELEVRLAEEPNIIAVSFSRYEYTRGQLVDWISKANKTVYVMVMAFTADQLADALITAHNRGVNVTVIIDDQYKTSAGSEYQRILNAGIDIRTDNSWRLMHHKVMVVDGYIIVTGSYNWSAAAEDDNWENIIILESTTISDTYMEEFNRIWQQTTPGA